MSYNVQTEQNLVLAIRAPKNIALQQMDDASIQKRAEKLAEFFSALSSGASSGATLHLYKGGAAKLAKATATWTVASGAGSVTATINGVAVSVTWATSDANTGSLMAAAVRAETNDLVEFAVDASNLAATITCATVVAGNWVEVDGARIEVLADAPASRFDAVTKGATNNAMATALGAAINAHPHLRNVVFAEVSAAVVTVRQIAGATGLKMTSSGSTLTVSATTLAATATVLLTSKKPGHMGNWITLAASGTGATASAARLASGVGGEGTESLLRR